MSGRDPADRHWRLVLLGLALFGGGVLLVVLGSSRDSRPPRRAELTPVPAEQAPTLLGDPGRPFGSVARSNSSGGTEPAASGVVNGMILDAETRTPISGAIVYLSNEAGGVARAEAVARSAESGAFKLPVKGVPGALESAALIVRSHEYCDSRVSLTRSGAALQSELLVLLERGATISGAVVDGQGNPISGARVVGYAPGAQYSWPCATDVFLTTLGDCGTEAMSDESGGFRLKGLDPDAPYLLYAEKQGYVPLGKRILHDELSLPGTRDIRLVLLPSFEFSLSTVDDESAQPIPYAGLVIDPRGRVRVRLRHPAINDDAPENSGRPLSPAGRFPVCLYAADGFARPDHVDVDFAAFALGYKSQRGPIRVKWGDTGEVLIRLKRLARGTPVPVRFRAHYAEGAPFSGFMRMFINRDGDESDYRGPGMVVALFERGRSQSALPLLPGTYYLNLRSAGPMGSWWHPARRWFQFTVPERCDGDWPASFQVEGGLLELSVLDPQGNAVRGYSLHIKYDDGVGRGPVRAWDKCAGARAEEDAPAASVCVSPVSGVARAWLEGVGMGEARFPELRNGRRERLKIVLNSPPPSLASPDGSPDRR